MIVSTSNNNTQIPISSKDIDLQRPKDLCSCGSNKKNPEKIKTKAFCGSREE